LSVSAAIDNKYFSSVRHPITRDSRKERYEKRVDKRFLERTKKNKPPHPGNKPLNLPFSFICFEMGVTFRASGREVMAVSN
jgi:hypothetical protein